MGDLGTSGGELYPHSISHKVNGDNCHVKPGTAVIRQYQGNLLIRATDGLPFRKGRQHLFKSCQSRQDDIHLHGAFSEGEAVITNSGVYQLVLVCFYRLSQKMSPGEPFFDFLHYLSYPSLIMTR